MTYWTTDLDLESRVPLHPLIEALDTHKLYAVNEFRRGRNYCAGIETLRVPRSPDAHARMFFRAIDSLPPVARRTLKACTHRYLDVAFNLDDREGRVVCSLRPDTLQELARRRITPRFTVYRESA